MTTLALRSIGSNDFAVIDDGDRVGRIRLAAEQRGEVWMWNIGLNIPGGVPNGKNHNHPAMSRIRDSF